MDKEIAFEFFVPFADCIIKTNNTRINNSKYIEGVMTMYNLTEYSNDYSKTLKRLWQF